MELDQYRVHSFIVNHYAAFVYLEGTDPATQLQHYRVEIKISDEVIIANQEPAYQLHVRTSRIIDNKNLTGYMTWKFRHCQQVIENNKPVRSDGVFTHIVADLDWIRSILDVEFDYHVGERNCRKKENAVYLVEYKKSQFSGYGPKFCDTDNLNLNISESNLAKRIFPM